MRRRYWLPGVALIGVGLVLRLFFVYLHFAGMFLMGVGAVVLLFGLVDALLPRFVWLRVVRLVMRIGAGLVALAMLVTGIAVGVACGGSKNPEADYVVVLGAGVNGTAPSRSCGRGSMRRRPTSRRIRTPWPCSPAGRERVKASPRPSACIAG